MNNLETADCASPAGAAGLVASSPESLQSERDRRVASQHDDGEWRWNYPCWDILTWVAVCGQVPKSVFSAEYNLFRELLRDLRVRKGVTQAQLSAALGMAQSFVSKYEMGERRLDFIEVGHICAELGIGLEAFAKSYADAVATAEGRSRTKKKGGSKNE